MEIIIFGSTQFSVMIAEMIKSEKKHNLLGFTVDEAFYDKTILNGLPVYPFQELSKYVNPSEVSIINTIGYTKMCTLRETIQDRILQSGYSTCGWISEKSVILSKDINTQNLILPEAYIGVNVKIGNHNIIYSNSILTHDIEIGNFNFVAAGVVLGGNIKIRNNCFFGLNSTVKNDVSIGNRVLVGASSYVDIDLTDNKVIVPQKSIVIDKKGIDLI
jgi:sugar O-acyltransferase (sialic acid O-acetyltransferase NeuD family)